MKDSPTNVLTTQKTPSKASIREVMQKMNKEVVARACNRFRSRVERVVEADGGFIE